MTHVSPAALAAYAAGDPGLDDVTAWGVEAHLDACARCRARLPVPELLDRVRTGLLDRAAAGPGPAPVPGRWRRWTGWSAAGWAVTAVIAVLAAFLLDRAYPQYPSAVLLVAPVAPLSGLAVAWSRRTDPAWETLAGTARAGLELVLRRTLVVLAATLPALTAAGLVLGESPALWLLPALTLTSAALWLGGRIGVAAASVVLAALWTAAAVVPAVVTATDPPLIRAAGVPGWAVAAIVCTVLALLRADGFRRLRSWR
ncbi:zf-HC2 domain-containing protein [Catenuloplanes atrovinosus]|uniref:Putative zinc-finger domain-containing protein n=1 Tax=Catenuloplanes atrovinosus TaxID=137266 RepID=A0AAE3YN82_9ACTN|nr:zf-HC2 domain-containing protein [Catenuloplanes atrovinosus]MDR7275476.1 hypothetical protein [Catenuloplanes atrovinosus]